MQNLRDKLLKAGAVKKSAAKKAKTQARQETKKKKLKSHHKDAEAEVSLYEEKLEKNKTAAKDKQAKINREKEEIEKKRSIEAIIREFELKKNFRGDQILYFTLGKAIRKIYLNEETVDALKKGYLAIVNASFDREVGYRLIEQKGAEKIATIDASYLLFYNRED